ncbi:DUF6088 family protein [Paraburkholderia sp. CI3]|uniref:DUF6088 family protein n=1 Tax=Paraburkholderia sp. CI3 TaxID=2991060 RepID=UPI003D1DE457
MRKSRLQDRVIRSIRRRRSVVVLRSELLSLGSSSQLSRVLLRLAGAGTLARVSHGAYAKTRVNRFTGRLAPAAPFETIAAETLRKLRVEVTHGTLAADYNAGRTTQIPMLPIANTGRRRIGRRIQVGRKTLLCGRPHAKARKGAMR